MKRVLVVHFSQTGQLARLARELLSPLPEAGHVELLQEVLRPIRPYPFPWSFWSFLEVMPETVLLEPPPLEPVAVRAEERFDLVVLAYQVWYLAPSGPMTAFLKSETGRRLMRGRPVVTVIACRNMWLAAQETVKRLIQEAGGRLRDNVALVDPRLIFSERGGQRLFSLWSRLIRRGGAPGSAGRRLMLALFCAYLVAAILLLVPLSLLAQRLMRPLLSRRLESQRAYFELPSGR